MTSKDDDTLPLPGFSQEFSVDTTVDEDIIPTSQPLSSEGPKTPKNSDGTANESTEDLGGACPESESTVDDTLPPEAVMDQSTLERDRSEDFIPDTETKKPEMLHANGDPSCRKKLEDFGTEDMFRVKSDPTWDADASKIPESPALENASILNDTPTEVLRPRREKSETPVTEIIVNDSAETVDLDATPVKIKILTSQSVVETRGSTVDGESCEETQILDNSSVLLLDPLEATCEDSSKTHASEKACLQRTAEDEHARSGGKGGVLAVGESPGKTDGSEDAPGVRPHCVSFKEEVQANAAAAQLDSPSIVTRKIDFKLVVSCFVTLDTKTKKVLQKYIINVNEGPKPKPKVVHVETSSDGATDKRYSTSSSGSVYSDKMGPFSLHKRISGVSEQTDTSEEEFRFHATKGRTALERVPWSNEFLLPLKMDDMMMASIESPEFFERPKIASSPRKPRSNRCNGVATEHLKEILESSSSEATSLCNSRESPSGRTPARRSVVSRKAASFGSEPPPPPEENSNGGAAEAKAREPRGDGAKESKPKPVAEAERDGGVGSEPAEGLTERAVKLGEDLPVLARWTDKRYYPGVLGEFLRNDRWEVKFDDGTSKAVREDFIMPSEWLEAGALVFAMVDEKYESGQIVNVKRGDEVGYVVELDAGEKEVSVRLSDLCLSDVMASIVREKHKPPGGTPRAKADIDCDNVLSGKRLREQRTPLRPTVAVRAASSGATKKSSSKARKNDRGGSKSIKKTPRDGTGMKLGGLKSENGHLVEDKVLSGDSPSGAEAVETPLRSSSREARAKAKPRSLSYNVEAPGKSRPAAVPGSSSVKSKKRKAKAPEPEEPKSKKSPARPKRPHSTERGKRKRKLDESAEGAPRKKSTKEATRTKARCRKE